MDLKKKSSGNGNPIRIPRYTIPGNMPLPKPYDKKAEENGDKWQVLCLAV